MIVIVCDGFMTWINVVKCCVSDIAFIKHAISNINHHRIRTVSLKK